MRVLFVCLGNICRSPTAEGVLRHQLQAAGLAGNPFKLIVEADRVALQLGHVRIAVQRVESPRRMPCRAGGENVALNEHHVFPTGLGEMVEDRAADDAAADDHNTRLGFHGNILILWGFESVYTIAPAGGNRHLR